MKIKTDDIKTKQNKTTWGWSNSTIGRLFALHKANPGLILTYLKHCQE